MKKWSTKRWFLLTSDVCLHGFLLPSAWRSHPFHLLISEEGTPLPRVIKRGTPPSTCQKGGTLPPTCSKGGTPLATCKFWCTLQLCLPSQKDGGSDSNKQSDPRTRSPPLPYLAAYLNRHGYFSPNYTAWVSHLDLAGDARDKELTCQRRRCERCGLDSWVGEIPWRRDW